MPGGPCRNRLCSRESRYRRFGRAYAIAYYDPGTPLSRALWAKERGDLRFLKPFGRLLAGHMLLNLETFLEYDLVVGVPMHKEKRRSRGFDQVEEIIRVAAPYLRRHFGERLDDLEAPCLVKVRATDSVKRLDYFESASELSRSIQLNPQRAREVEGKRILIVDDVFTTGSTMNACAWVLKRGKAEQVDGLVVARKRWTY